MDGGGRRLNLAMSPVYIWTLRIVVAATGLMVLLSCIFSFVRGAQFSMFFLLGVNIIISGFLAGWNTWSYQKGDMAADKHWILLVIGIVVIWQCIATNIYVFHLPLPVADINNSTMSLNGTTEAPPFTSSQQSNS